MVNDTCLESACSEVGQFSDEKLANEFDRFFRSQPPLCEFIVEVTQESGQQIQELALFLSYIVFKAVEASIDTSPQTVQPVQIEAAYRQTELWMTRLSESEGAELQKSIAQSLQQDTEPYLLQYVISELNDPMEDGASLDDEAKGEVFFVLKTVIASLCDDNGGAGLDARPSEPIQS